MHQRIRPTGRISHRRTGGHESDGCRCEHEWKVGCDRDDRRFRSKENYSAPSSLQGMKVRKTPNVGKNVRAANGAYIPNQGETTITGKDAGGHRLKVVAQVADVTKNLASVMEMVDRGNWVIFHKEEGYIQTMKEEEEVKMKTLMIYGRTHRRNCQIC